MQKYSESPTVELKREVTQDLKKGIVAFANTDGGTLYVGVGDDGNIVGIDDCDDTMQQVGNMIRDGIKPDLTAYSSIEAITESGKTIVKVTVLRGARRPYHLSDKGLKPSGVFVRHGVSSVPATDEVIRQLLRESDGVTFDKSRCLNQELAFDYTRKYFADAGVSLTDSNMRTLLLIDADGYYTNAALLLSEQCEHNIKVAVYEGEGKELFKARQEFGGSILRQIDEAFGYVSLNNNQNSTFDGLRRIDRPDYPHAAVREALLNAVVHRDYDYSGSIIINIYNDRMEFISIGGLVKGITVADIMNGVSQPRNTVIAEVFYRLNLIESYGTGIQKIMESYAETAEKPVFRPAPASFAVVLPKRSAAKSRALTPEGQEAAVVELAGRQGFVARRDVEQLLQIAKHPAVAVLNRLVDKGKLIKTGSARAVRYMYADSMEIGKPAKKRRTLP
ncbi:MAG: putative DNA binding domain-containing protein [Lachnospiraceae bacterium]|jgi:ATP-dependent DNA helicase RecG|nr:putative DNA binding domain-containing protein [Lachnospiraceae bacterium]